MKVGRYLGWRARTAWYHELVRISACEVGVVSPLYDLYRSVDRCVDASATGITDEVDAWVAGALPPQEPGFVGERRRMMAPENHLDFWNRVYYACSKEREREHSEALGDVG